MPTGTEALLRKDWKTRHNFNLSGGWLCSEDTMAKIYTGLNADHPYLFIPDISAIIRRSNLSQKTAKSGTLITSEGVQQVDCTLDPCTNHLEFYLRMRAYLATIAFLCIAGCKPDFLTLETAIEVSDYMFEQINCRADGRRPTLMCLTACYLSMLSSYAKEFQNEGVKLEDWLKTKSNWEYLWKESVTHWENTVDGSSSSKGSITEQGFNIPADIVTMVRNNDQMLRSFKGSIDGMARKTGGNPNADKTERPWTKGKGKGKGGKAQKGANNGGGNPNAGQKRQVQADGSQSTGFKAWNKRFKKRKGGN
jgi:hypothetical protein